MKDELCHWLDSHPKETSTKLDEMMVDSEHNSRHLIQHLYVRNLRTLGVGQWLDDEVINYFVKKWCSASTSRKTLGLNTWFAGRFLFQDHRCVRARTGIITPEHEQKVLRWCLTAQGKQGVQSWENVFIPINENNHHWYSACINFPDKRIDIYDSFSETYYGNYKKPIHLKENTPIMLVLMWLAQVLGHLRGEEVCLSNQAYTEWKCEPHQKVPFQHNSYDCGVHILWHLLHVLEFGSVRSDCTSPKLKFASDMVGKRLRLAYEIMEDSGLSLAKPISSTVANDIILLSSLLTGPKALTTWSLQHEQGEDTNWQDTLAILLNVDCSEISYAIAGTINYDVVKCIVYSGCKEAISRLNLSTPCGENQGESAEQVIRPDSARGARLLKGGQLIPGADRKPVGRLWAVAQSAVVHVEAALLEYVYDNHAIISVQRTVSALAAALYVGWRAQDRTAHLRQRNDDEHRRCFLEQKLKIARAFSDIVEVASSSRLPASQALESTIVDGTAREAECGMDVDLPDGPSDGEGSTSSEYLKGDQRQGEDGIDSEQSIGDTTMQDLDDVELQDTAEVFDFLPDTDMEDAEEGGTRDSAFQSIRHALFTGNEDSWVYKWHPTAGAVIGHEPTAHERWKSIFHPEKKTGQPYLPFGSRLDWEIAQWAIKEKIPQNSFDRLLKIPEVKERLGLSFTHSRSMLKIIDEIPEPRGHWAVKKFSFKDRPHEHFTVRYRDPVEAIKGLWGSPAFAEHLVYKPAKLFRREEETDENRIYSEMWTGGLWNAAQYLTQEAVPEGATIAPSIRRKPGSRACVLIAYLSADKPDKTGLSPDSLRLRKREIFHRSMAAVLQPLKEAGDPKGRGLELVGGDGAVRRVYPILAVYVADYPEQCLVTCTKSGTCPRCRRKADELELPTPGIPRKQAWTQQIIQDAYSSCSTQLAAHELCMEDDVSGAVYQPFWVGFPLSDIHRTMAPDVLHQLYLGVIPYLILWTQGLMGEGELDKRASALPPTFGVRHFKKGISQLSQVTGSERKQMAQILLSCLIGKIHTKGIIACRSLLHFAYLAQYHSHEHDTLEYMKADLKTWHRYRSYFIAQGTREAFNIPKFHALLHYIESIQMLGTTDNYSSEMFERLHIDFAKEGWRASNKRDPFPQMITWLSRREKIASYDFYLSWLEQEFSPDGSGSSNKDKLGGDKAGNGADDGNVRDSDEDGACDEDDDEEDGDEEGDEITPNKSVPRTPNAKPAIPSIFLAKHPREPKKSLSKIVTSHAAPSFIPHLKLFLNSLLPVNQQVSKNQALQGTLPFTALDVWHQVKIRRPHAVDDHPDGLQETLKSIPVWKRAATSRFDTAILLDTDKAESNGVDGCRVARLQIIFQLPSLISHDGFPGRAPPEWPTEPLVYVAWFSRFKDIDATTGMYRVDRPKNPHGLAHGAIVPLVNIRQSCIWKNTCVFSSL
ncbi:hypothetical protein D9757_015183 [Collybiopsis confluens]|uniref:Ubiquitin-like protease family profile domain-containing protein n=1 Tax=Collybiopsis confluens TaxID=2823264 RepID=A0A8H5G0C3_9AGAR|nr:hypothetical protein D9757_015183 [Collybiopsis confluens]